MSEHLPPEDTRPLPRSCAAALVKKLRPELFKAFADPSRIAVICRLATTAEPQTVTEIADCCGVHISGVSRHLATLRDAGVVRAKRRGREVLYHVDSEYVSQTLRDLAEVFDLCRAACCQGDTR